MSDLSTETLLAERAALTQTTREVPRAWPFRGTRTIRVRVALVPEFSIELIDEVLRLRGNA